MLLRKTFPLSRQAEVCEVACNNVRLVFSATFLSWPKSYYDVSRLFAGLLRCATTDVHVRSPCLGGLSNIDLTIKYFKSKESCFDGLHVHLLGLHAIRLKFIFVEQDDLIGALVDVEMLFSNVFNLMGLRFCLLEWRERRTLRADDPQAQSTTHQTDHNISQPVDKHSLRQSTLPSHLDHTANEKKNLSQSESTRPSRTPHRVNHSR